MENALPNTQENTQSPQSEMNPSLTPQSSSIDHTKKRVFPILTTFLVLSLGTTAFLAYQNMQLTKQLNQTSNAVYTPSPTPELPSSSQSTSTTKTATTTDFSYQDFKITYSNDWQFSEMSSSDTFPLKERLQSLYANDKVIAFSKKGTSLLITIEKAADGGAGGIFTTDQEYIQFLTDKDPLTIGNSTFYISKSHSDVASLLESHAGPWGWGSVTEYIPSKTAGSGDVYKGYENVIKRGTFAYNFIVTSNTGGATDPQLHNEIISLLETIEW